MDLFQSVATKQNFTSSKRCWNPIIASFRNLPMQFGYHTACFAAWLITALLLFTSHATAASISIAATTDVQVDEANQVVNLKFTLTNEGDELAREVGVEFPSLNESVIPGREVYPKQKVEHEQKIPFEKLGIKGQGIYAIPFRVLYKDANYYPFSAPYVASLTVGTAPTRGVNIELTDREFFEPIAMLDSVSLEGIVESITAVPLSDVKLEALHSSEFAVELTNPVSGAKLALGNTTPFALTVKNRSALPRSEYVLILLISGVAEGKHFAEPFYLRLQIVSGWRYYRTLLIAGIIAVVVAGLITLSIKRKA